MAMNETTFENARVGDRLWDVRYGWGEIIDIDAEAARPLTLYFKSVGFCLFFLDGCCNKSVLRTLFWDEIKFETPPRPVRKVKKVVEGWVNMSPCITESPCREPLHINAVYRSEQDAFFNRLSNCIYLGEPLFIRHEYEVEE